MKSVKILSLNADSASTLMKSVMDDIGQVVANDSFETAVESREKGEMVHIYYRFTGKDDADMLIETKEKGEFSLIWVNGKMNRDEIMHTFSNGK